MATLPRELRKELERTVRDARRIAEDGTRKSLEQLAVHHHEPWTTLTPDQRQLRNRLRAHGRQLGDRRNDQRGTQEIGRLTQECAYEQWHRMLFARFLAENDLLIEPNHGVAISLDECQELARSQGEDWLALASSFAVRMLPQIFRQGDPVLEVALPPETRSKLEDLLKKLPREVFVADDSLGWVYQFWQADRKEEINESERKIGADELPAVTQLFTEDYMVLFLLHNTLGAWWAGKVLAQNPALAHTANSEDDLRTACSVGGIEWTYLRFVREKADDDAEGPWRPAAGTFEGWPKAAKEITLLDPCMGSGHFLVFALPILVAFRTTEEGLSPEAAMELVLRDNLFGLEIDQRCTQIAAFNLALAAWRMVGYRQLPTLNLACSGLAPRVTKDEWMKLAERAAAAAPVPPERNLFGSRDNLFSRRIKDGIGRLHDLFTKAPWLGSLIDPRLNEAPLAEATFVELEPLFSPMVARHTEDELTELAVTGQGMAKAAELLSRRFVLIATNIPYLGRGKQENTLRDYCSRTYPNAKADLAICFLERSLNSCGPSCSIALVTPQNWLFLGAYEALRKRLLREVEWNFVATLGPRAFETISGEIVRVALITMTNRQPKESNSFASLDPSGHQTIAAKKDALCTDSLLGLDQPAQRTNPDSRIILEQGRSTGAHLSDYVESYQGAVTGDLERFTAFHWEVDAFAAIWEPFRTAIETTDHDNGLMCAIRWEHGTGELDAYARLSRDQLHDMHESGQRAWGKTGVAINRMGGLYSTVYNGTKFDNNVAVLIARSVDHLPAILAFCSSDEFSRAVRNLDQTLKVTNQTLRKVQFDLSHWQEVGRKKYSGGLSMPNSIDPTQWNFSGNPIASPATLQVGVARVLGYRWPRQSGSSFPDCPALNPDGLEKHTDSDGIVCLSPIKGVPAADERLRALLSDAYGVDWSAAKLAALLTGAGFENNTLEDWLRDGFFAEHCELFHQRPFIWHIWDGRRDGFNALVNYHRLAAANGDGRRTLEKLIYTYLGAWIDLQREAQRQGLDGADARLAAAEHLKQQLEKILAGEPPYDIFVRWKPLHQQAIGWEPDINDGLRINIRPFMMAKPLGAKKADACILRVTPKNVAWNKDRGKEPHRSREDFPWFWTSDDKTDDFAGGKTFDGNRWNNLHYTNKFKQTAREQHSVPRAKAAR